MTKDRKGKPENEVDQVTGTQTTGHEWDGLKELDTPAPRWWLIVWAITIVFSVGYWVVYPAWPTISGHSKGLFGWTQYEKLKGDQAEIVSRQGEFLRKFQASSFEQVAGNPKLFEFARAGGSVVFKENCAACHGAGGEGRPGYPNLNDDDWMFGGTVDQIFHTVEVGSRSIHPDTYAAMMPAFGAILKRQEIDDVATYVGAMNATQPPSVGWVNGQVLYQANCVACHGATGEGNRELGAPRLNDAIWLYGGDHETLVETITKSRSGVMPSWQHRLAPDDQRMVAVYVHSLGGGE